MEEIKESSNKTIAVHRIEVITPSLEDVFVNMFVQEGK
jgi:hypothetical protein